MQTHTERPPGFSQSAATFLIIVAVLAMILATQTPA